MSDSEKPAKAAYAQPKLMVYGGFSQLTAAGSGGILEGMAMTNLMRRA
jgi:hypothetical protein